ncbi:MAG: NfeD family protein [Clostridia bacterium]|nr:NfeD family protein [Clostridia bacterium]
MVQYMLAFWIIALVAFVIIEAVTAQLVTIWFAVGAIAALIAERLGAETWLQWTIFVAVSAIVLIATRPFVKKLTQKKAQPTNADRCIGESAVVTEQIDNIAGKGAVKINGIEWSARTLSGENIETGRIVKVIKIDGVKLIVE